MKKLLKPQYVFFPPDSFEVRCENGANRTVSFGQFEREYRHDKGYIVEVEPGKYKRFNYEQWFDWMQLGIMRKELMARLEWIINKEEVRTAKVGLLMTTPKEDRDGIAEAFDKLNIFGKSDTDASIPLNNEDIVSTEAA